MKRRNFFGALAALFVAPKMIANITEEEPWVVEAWEGIKIGDRNSCLETDTIPEHYEFEVPLSGNVRMEITSEYHKSKWTPKGSIKK